MTFIEFKDSIEQGKYDNRLYILNCEDCFFVADQYINAISNTVNKPVQYITDVKSLYTKTKDIFGVSQLDNNIKVFKTNDLSELDNSCKTQQNTFIVTTKLSKTVQEEFKQYIVNIPKLEDWCIKDYLYSNLEELNNKELDWLYDITNGDIYRIQNELDKFNLFNSEEKPYLFKDMKSEGAFSDLSSYNVFNLTNSIVNKDLVQLSNVLKEIKRFDAEPLGVISILYQSFKKLILVLLASNPTPESTGLKSNVIYAIKKNSTVYNKHQLLEIFKFLTNIDKQLKTGKIEIPWLIDYAICKILTIM